jgi:hypothetical protein
MWPDAGVGDAVRVTESDVASVDGWQGDQVRSGTAARSTACVFTRDPAASRSVRLTAYTVRNTALSPRPCDNNLPNTGGNPALADDNEFIVVKEPGLRGE